MEKEPESMAVQMKSDYAASEVYSTTGSEAPPAYKLRQANSVKIAKIIGVTVILAAFILGSFILASTYLQARASCDQMQALDAVLDKELILEAMQQELPKAEALLQNRKAIPKNLQSIDRALPKKRLAKVEKDNALESSDSVDSSDSDSSSDSQYSDSDESADMNNNRVHIKLPLDLDLSDLANAFQNNQKSLKMNCVVERQRSEEYIDEPAKSMNMPFGMSMKTDPKKQKLSGERMAIFCESGNQQRPEETEPVRQMLIPIPPQFRTFGPITHMPQQMAPQGRIHQMPPRPVFQPSNMRNHPLPPVPAQMMQAPRPDAPNMIRPIFPQQMHPQQQSMLQQGPQGQAEVRIHVQRMELPEILRRFLPPHMQGNGPVAPEVQVREVPLDIALQNVGISQDELKEIHDVAAQKFAEQLKQLIGDVSDSEENDSSDEDQVYQFNGQPQQSQEQQMQQQQLPQRNEPKPQNAPQILQMGRSEHARHLLNPIDLPVRVMHPLQEQSDMPIPRHVVQPRSVRSVDNLLHREKRVKRCACDCSC